MGSRAVDSGRRTSSGAVIYVPRRDLNKKKKETTTFQGRTVSVIRRDLDVGGGSPAVAPQPTSSGSSRSTSTSQPQPTQESIQEEQRRDTVVDSGRRTSTGQPIYISPQQALREQATKPQIQPLGIPSQQMQQTRREMPAPYSPQQQQSILTTQWKKEQEEKTERAVAASKEAQLYSGIAVESLRGMGYSTAETANVLRGQTAITEEQYKSIEPTITRATGAGVTATTLATDKQRLAYESGAVKDVPAPTFVPPPTRTETIKQNIADWNTVVKESKLYKPISRSLSQSADYFRERAQDRRALFNVRSQDAIALRYTMDDDSLKAKAFDVGYKISSSVIDFQSKRDSAVAGFSQFFADKPVTAGLIATTGAGVAAGGAIVGGAVGAGMLAVGVKPAIVTASGVATSKAVVGSGLTLFTAGTLASGAQIRDPDVRFEFYGEQAGKLAVAVAGAQTFKMTSTGIAKARFARTPKEATGVVRFTEGVRTDVMGKVKIGTKSYDFKTQSFKEFGKGTFTKDVGTIEAGGKKVPFTSRQVQVGRDTFVRETGVKGAGKTVEVIKQTQEPLGFKSIPKKGLTVDTKISGLKETPRVIIGKDIKFDQKVEFRFDSKTVPKTTLAQRFTDFNKALGKRASLGDARPQSDDLFGTDFTGTRSGLRPDIQTPTSKPLGKPLFSSKLQTSSSPTSKINIPSPTKSIGTVKPTAGMPNIQSLFNVFAPVPTQAPVFLGFLGVGGRGITQTGGQPSIKPSILTSPSTRFDLGSISFSPSVYQPDFRTESITTPITTGLTKTDTTTRFDSISGFTPWIPTPFTPFTPMIPIIIPFKPSIPAGSRFTGGRGSFFRKRGQKTLYTPTLRAMGLGLTSKGKKKPKGMLTGLEERY